MGNYKAKLEISKDFYNLASSITHFPKFFPFGKMAKIRNNIATFVIREDETLYEA